MLRAACVCTFILSSASAFVNFSLNLHTHSSAHMAAYSIFVLTTDDKRIYFPFESLHIHAYTKVQAYGKIGIKCDSTDIHK